MHALPAVLKSFGASVRRSPVAFVFFAALLSGFFVPYFAGATITSLVLIAPDSASEEWRGTRLVTWDATTASGGSNTVSVLLSTDSGANYNRLIATGIDAALESYAWDTTIAGGGPLADGNTYRVKIMDGATGLDFSSADFTVDNTDPSTAIDIERAVGDTGTGDWYSEHPTITLTCTDNLSGCNKVYYQWDDRDVVDEVPGIGGEIVIDFPAPAPDFEGEHTLTYWSDDEATDKDGVRNVEEQNSVDVNVDTITPTVAVSSDTADGFYNEGDAIDVTLTFSEPVWSLTGVTVNLDSGGSCLTSAFSDTSEVSCSYTVDEGHNSSSLDSDGLVGTVVDIAGNPADLTPTSDISESKAIVIDTVAPATLTLSDVDPEGGTVRNGWWNSTNTGVEVSVPVDDDTSLEGGTIQLQARAGSGAFANIGDAYTIMSDDIDDTVGIELSAEAIEAISGFAEGSVLAFTAVITDRAENATTQTQSSDTLTVDQVAPDVNAGSDREVNTATNQDDATVSDDPPSSGSLVYLWSQVSGDAGTVAFSDSDEVNPTISLPASDGTDDDIYGLLLTATDAAGNSASDGITFVWDTTAPELAEVTPVTDPTDDTTPDYTFSVDSTGWLPGHTGGAITYGGACKSATLTATEDENTITLTQSDIGGSPFANGTYSDCTIVVTDAAGNASDDGAADPLAITEFEIDTIPAAIATAITYDTDQDGDVETVDVIFDDEINPATFVAGEFTIGGTVATGVAASSTNPMAVVLTVTDGVAGTESKSIVYSGSTAKDLAGNTIAGFTQGSVDLAGPVPMSARTIDTTHITVTFSEDLDGSSDGTGDFDVDDNDVDDTDESGGVVTLTLDDSIGTGETPEVTVYGDGESGLQDLNGNWSPQEYDLTPSDGIAPVLTDVSIESDNDNDTSLAKVGDMVTLTFTSSEMIATPVVTIGAGSADVTYIEDNVWTATRTMTADDADGIVTFSIAFEDVVEPANEGTTVTETNDDDPGSSVLFDKNAPDVDAGPLNEVNDDVIQASTISDEEPDAGSGIATWEWSFEQIAGASGGIVSFSPSAEGTSDDADVTISADTDGVYTLTLTVTDNAGNENSDTATLIWDTMAPRLEYIVPNHGSANISTEEGDVLGYFRVLNHGSLPENITLENDSLVFLEDAGGEDVQDGISVDGDTRILRVGHDSLSNGTTYCLTVLAGAVRDTAGNLSTQDFTGNCFTTELDTTPPFITLLMSSEVGAMEATIEAQTDEPALCRISDMDQQFSDMSPFDESDEDWTTHTVTLGELNPESLYNFYVRCQDEEGNTMTNSGHVQFATGSDDTEAPPAPVITTTGDVTVNSDTYVIAGALDEDTPEDAHTITVYAGSATAGTIDLVSGQTGWAITVLLPQNATTTFTAQATDAAGNESETSNAIDIGESDTIGADGVAPEVPAITTGAATVDAATYTIAGTEADDGGTRTVYLVRSGSIAGSATLPAGTTNWSILVGLNQNGANTFSAKAADASGNTSAESSPVTITESPADATPPAIVDTMVSEITTSSAMLTVTTDGTAACKIGPEDVVYGSLPYTLTAVSPTLHTYELGELNDNTAYDFYVRCQDTSGNASDSSHVTFTTDANDAAATLHVDGITNVRTAAIADNEWEDGWAWTFRITVPSDETEFWMSFTDFAGTVAPNAIPAAGNIRYYSEQSDNAANADDAIEITEANAYPESALMVDTAADIDTMTAGIQIDVRVEVKVPTDTPADTYSGSYRIKTEAPPSEV